MNTMVNFRHMESTPALKDYAEQKVTRLMKYVHKPIKLEIWLEASKTDHIAESEVTAKELNMKFSERGEDMYAAIDLLVDKMEKALRREKDKRTDHRPRA